MASIRKTYEKPLGRFNTGGDVWPAEIPPMTADQARNAGRRLWRWAMGTTFEGKVIVTSGNRYTWGRWQGNNLALMVNPDQGWREFIHSLSHYFDWHLNRHTEGWKPHNKHHARLERRMVREVLKRGWLDS